MDHNGFVLSPALHLVDLLHHSDNGVWIGAPYLGAPVLDVELGHLVGLARLREKAKPAAITNSDNTQTDCYYGNTLFVMDRSLSM